MTSRISTLFGQEKAFVGYLTVGDGGMDRSFAVAQAMIKGGVNLLELGVPFSDPIADGPVIQRAAQRALQNGTTLRDIISLAAKLRLDFSGPLILFSYYNPLLVADSKKWLPKAKKAGIDGVLVVDLPYEEGEAFYAQCKAHAISPIFVVTPATNVARLKKILPHAEGFVYYAARKGTTGVQASLPTDFSQKIAIVKKHTALPVVAGFGIADNKAVKTVLQHADGFVVGSYFLKALEEGMSLDKLIILAKQLIG